MAQDARGAAPSGGGSILARTATGAGWMFAWRMTTRVLGLGSTLVLVRLLAPEDFGLVALAFAFASTLELVLATGVEAQIIRARETSRALYDTVFTLNVLRGALLAALVFAIAGPAAAVFGEPRLEAVIAVLALVPLLAGLANPGAAEFQRNLDFAKVFQLLIVPRLAQIALTIGLAFLLRSHWALIVGVLGGRVLQTLFTYIFHPYRPRASLAMWRDLLAISFWTWAFNVAVALRDRTEIFVIGWLLGPRAVGVYTVSVEIAALPTTELANPISQAAMPGFAATAREATEPGTVAESFLRVYALALLVSVPCAFGISLLAGPVVALALGQRWLDAAPLITILGAGYVTVPLMLICVALLNAQARLRTLLLFTLAGIGLRGGAVLALAPFHGLPGMAVGICLAVLVEVALVTVICCRRVGLPLARIPLAAWRSVAAGAAMVGALVWTGLGWLPPPATAWEAALVVAAAVPLGALAYGGTLAALWFACGRPPGAEADLLAFLGRTAGAAARRLRPVARRPGMT